MLVPGGWYGVLIGWGYGPVGTRNRSRRIAGMRNMCLEEEGGDDVQGGWGKLGLLACEVLSIEYRHVEV